MLPANAPGLPDPAEPESLGSEFLLLDLTALHWRVPASAAFFGPPGPPGLYTPWPQTAPPPPL